MKTKIVTSAVIAAAALMVSVSQVHATSTLELISGTSTVIFPTDATPAGYTINGWTLTANGTVAGTPLAPIDDLSSVNVTANGSSPLYVIFSVTGNITPTPATALAIQSGTWVGGSLAGSYATYYDSLNTILAETTTLTGPQAFTASSLSRFFGGSATGTITGAIPFSLTQVLKITSGEGSIDDDLLVSSSVPDGGMTLVLLGGALATMTLIRSKIGKL